MPLTKVTITGADDGVDPEQLFAISGLCPFVEWGILHSTSRRGTPRYPSERWLEKLRDMWIASHGAQEPLSLSAHLCGELARRTLDGDETAFVANAWPYQRIQVNGFNRGSAEPITLEGGFASLLDAYPKIEFIAQLGNLSDTLVAAALSIDAPNLTGLFDASGGEGKSPSKWPKSPANALRCGYAGGINPTNISLVLGHLKYRDEPFWIDIETGARSDNAFDIGVVRELLRVAQSYVHDGAQLAGLNRHDL